jgi:hypothetical protein
MALHVTHVATPALAVAETSSRRTALASAVTGRAAAGTATPATRTTASFGSLLATGSSVARPAVAVSAQTVKRSTIAAASSTTNAGTTASGTGTSTSTATASASGLSDFELLFGGSSYNPADPLIAQPISASASASTTAAAAAPTPQSVFGPSVWMTNPIGLNPDGSTFQYNPIYFATQSTAEIVAKMIGGTVVADNEFTQPAGNVFVQQQPNYMVKMPNGAMINPGLVASFYSFGFSQSQINTMVAQEVANTPPRAQTT